MITDFQNHSEYYLEVVNGVETFVVFKVCRYKQKMFEPEMRFKAQFL